MSPTVPPRLRATLGACLASLALHARDTLVARDLDFPNGIAFSPDGRTLFVTASHQLLRVRHTTTGVGF